VTIPEKRLRLTAVIGVPPAFLVNAGQVCATTSRLYIHRSIAPQFIEGLKGIYRAAAEQMGPDDGPMGVPPVTDK
jgi:acyl-CoA reductase-like NAD-dependent aldehyde dehydrogenase